MFLLSGVRSEILVRFNEVGRLRVFYIVVFLLVIMVNKKHIMLDLDDPRVGKIADVISNKTAKKIVGYLADNEVSEAEIVRDLKLPANTVNYNIKNLLEAGLIERTKKFFSDFQALRNRD